MVKVGSATKVASHKSLLWSIDVMQTHQERRPFDILCYNSCAAPSIVWLSKRREQVEQEKRAQPHYEDQIKNPAYVDDAALCGQIQSLRA